MMVATWRTFESNREREDELPIVWQTVRVRNGHLSGSFVESAHNFS